MLVPMKDIVEAARKGKYAVAAPNVFDYATIKACLEVAEELNSPIIIDWSAGPTGKPEMVYDMISPGLSAIREARVPVALNNDHGASYEVAVNCIHAGFSSVMVDRSELPFEENIAQVSEIVKIAHACGVSVEAELGHVGWLGLDKEEDIPNGFTDPDKAEEFIERTGIDCLAIAIGTAHGIYKGTPKLQFDILEKVNAVSKVPLVLHGGSSTGEAALQKAISLGICKINLASDLFNAGTKVSKEYFASDEPMMNFWVGFMAGIEGYKAKLRHYMKLFGSENKA